MNEGDKVCLALDHEGLDKGTVIQRAGIHKIRVLWEDGEETVEKQEDLRTVRKW